MTSWWESYGWPGLSHAIGALGFQIVVAYILFVNDVPNFWWYGALVGGGIFVLREFWQWRQKVPPVMWQNRFPWDAGTAVVPTLLVALITEFI